MTTMVHIRGGSLNPGPPTSMTEAVTEATNETEDTLTNGSPPNSPENSARPWNFRSVSVVAGAFIVNMVSFGWVSSTAFFINYYKTHQFAGTTNLQLCWLLSVSLALMYIASWPIAWLSIVIGPSMIIAAGSVTHLLGLVLLARSTQLWSVLVTQGFITPLGASMVFNATIPVMMQWFRQGVAMPVGITAAGSSIGGVIYPVLINYLLPAEGFENTLIVAIAVLSALFVIVAMSVQLPRDSTFRDTSTRVPRAQLIEPLKEGYFMVFGAAGAMFLGGYAVIMAFIVTIASDIGVGESWQVLVIMNGSSFIGRIIPLLIAGRVGRYNTLTVMTGLSSILTLALLYPSQNAQSTIYAFAVCWGVSAGAFISLMPATVTQSSPYPQIGLRIGVTYFFMSLTGLTWPGIAATIPGDSNTSLILFSGISQLVGCLLFLLARFLQTGWPRITVI